MKKFLLIIFIFLNFLNFRYVFASESQFTSEEFITGIAYTKYNGKIRWFKNAMIIENVDTGQVAYCLEPFSDLVNYSSYTSFDSYDSRFGIDRSTWDLIQLYAYYGYGYYGHTDKKWISITQLTIWRELYPEYEFEWLDNVKDRNVIHPYDREIDELHRLVNSHYKLPSFKDEYVISINENYDLIDTNYALNNFEVTSSDFDYEIITNGIRIKSVNEEKEGKIVLSKPQMVHNNNSLFYYNSSSQKLIQSGNIEPFNITIKVRVEKGDITVKKKDSITGIEPQGEGQLDGAVFNLFDKDMNLIDKKEVVNKELVFDNLSFGKYYVSEDTPGIGYQLNNKLYEVTIDENNTSSLIEIGNDIIQSKIKIIKYFGTKKEYEKGNMQKESNVKFEIYDSNNKLVYSGETNEEGIIETILPYGNYLLKQVSTTLGYQMNSDYSFSVNDNNNVSSDIILYDFKIEVPNAGISYYNLIRWSYD